MNDYCYEVLVKKNNGRLRFLFPVLSYSAFTVFAVLFNVIPLFIIGNYIYITGMISFGIWYLIHRANRKLNVEYELSIVNDSFSVTSITDGKKRESLIDCSLRDCDYIGPVTKERFADDRAKAAFTLNTTGEVEIPITDDYWYILVNAGSYRYIDVFKFEDDMYPNFRRYNPRGTEFMKITPKPQEDEDSDDE